MELPYPRYKPELDSEDELPEQHFSTDTEAWQFFSAIHRDNLISVIKDNGNEIIEVIINGIVVPI